VLERDLRAQPDPLRLAHRVSLSASRLQHLFKQEFRVSIGQYVRRARMEAAPTLIEDPTLRISEIADRLGFGRPSNFSHAFRQQYGVSPRRFRSMLASVHRDSSADQEIAARTK